MRLRRRLARLLLLFLAVTVAGLPSATRGRTQPAGLVKIGTQSPLSGAQAPAGEAIMLGARLAVEQLKGPVERLGFRVELVPFDDQGKPAVGVANARIISADPAIVGVVGHLNLGVTLPASEIYREASLAMISPANTNPLVTDRNYPNVSRVCGRDDAQGEAAALFAQQHLGAASAYLLHDGTPYGRAVAEAFRDKARALGIAIQGFEAFEERADVGAIVARLAERDPDLVYFGGIYAQAGGLFRAAREKGVRARLLGPDGMNSPALARLAGPAAVGVHYTLVVGPVGFYPEAAGFAEEYRTRFGKEPEPFTAQAYDATAILLLAIETAIREAGGARPDRAEVSRAVRKVTGYRGVTGTIGFDGKGDPLRARYFVVRVVSDDPAAWGQNRVVAAIEIPAPPLSR